MNFFYKIKFFWFLFIILALQPCVLNAQSLESDSLNIIKRKINEGSQKKKILTDNRDKLKTDISTISAQRAKIAQRIQSFERQIYKTTEKLAPLNQTHKETQKALQNDYEIFKSVVIALQRIAYFPPEAMIALPTSPADTVRTAILLRASVSALRQRANLLSKELKKLSKTKKMIAIETSKFENLILGLNQQHRHLSALMARKEVLKRRTDSKIVNETHRLSILAKKAKNLQELITQLRPSKIDKEKAIKKNPNLAKFKLRLFAKAKGKLFFPVVGRLTSRYGKKATSGAIQKGITIETLHNAQVIAPYYGKAVFTGQFRGYGLLLIIEHTGGYHSLLSGLGRIDVVPGSFVIPGEPLGVMGVGIKKKPVLYAEFRHNGKPINLISWFNSYRNTSEVNG